MTTRTDQLDMFIAEGDRLEAEALALLLRVLNAPDDRKARTAFIRAVRRFTEHNDRKQAAIDMLDAIRERQTAVN